MLLAAVQKTSTFQRINDIASHFSGQRGGAEEQGIKENELFIFSHPEWRSQLEAHFQRMLAAYPQA